MLKINSQSDIWMLARIGITSKDFFGKPNINFLVQSWKKYYGDRFCIISILEIVWGSISYDLQKNVWPCMYYLLFFLNFTFNTLSEFPFLSLSPPLTCFCMAWSLVHVCERDERGFAYHCCSSLWIWGREKKMEKKLRILTDSSIIFYLIKKGKNRRCFHVPTEK